MYNHLCRNRVFLSQLRYCQHGHRFRATVARWSCGDIVCAEHDRASLCSCDRPVPYVGLIIDGAALVVLPSRSAPSGFNGLAGIDGNGRIDYDTPVSFSFFAAGNDGVLGTTDFFGYSADLFGSSGNIITISAYGLDGLLVGQASYTETGNFTTPLTISGVGQFHSVTVDQTLYNTSSGGIALDLVQFGNISIAAIPEPQTYAMLLAGLSLLGFMARRKKQNIQSDHKVL